MPRVICKQPQTFQEPYTIQTLTFESGDEMIRCDHVFKFLVGFFFFWYLAKRNWGCCFGFVWHFWEYNCELFKPVSEILKV